MKFRKNYRILFIYSRLCEGKCLSINSLANEFNVDSRTIQRDIADIRAFLSEQSLNGNDDRFLYYCREKNSYVLKHS